MKIQPSIHGCRVRGQPVPSLTAALAATILIALSAAAEDTGSVAGQVVPAHDHDLVLATARIPDLALKVAVAADGTFRFDHVRAGSYLVEVRVPSLGTAAEVVEVHAGAESTIEIELLAGSHADEIVVTGSAIARDPFDLANPITTLSGDELALRLAPSLGETLAQEAGVSSTFFGPGASRPIIRGLAGDRVRMLEGGLGTGDASSVSADHAVTAEPIQAERIEVLRGPSTLLYGSSAIGGAVNVVDERIPTGRATRPIGGLAQVRGATATAERTASLGLDGGGGDWAWHADAFARDTDDYEAPGLGLVPNTDIASRGARAGVSTFFGDRGFLGVSIGGLDSEYGIPGGIEPGGHDDGAPIRIDMAQRRLDFRGEITRPFGAFQGLRLRLGGTDYEHVELEGPEAGTRFFSDLLEGRVELIQRQRGRHSGSFGAQVLGRELDAVGAEAFLPRTSTGRWALFTLQEIAAGPLRWQVGARFEAQDIDPEGTVSRSHDGLSASGGLVWTIGDRWSLAASVARSIKLPAPEELFSHGLHAATRTFEIGDPDLREEAGLGFDVSMRKTGGRLTGELTLFRQAFDGFIYQASTGTREEGFPVVVYSQADATFEGLELTARIEIYDRDGRHLHLRLVGDRVVAALDAGGDLPRIPPMRFGAGLHFHSERWSASGEVRWTDDQDRVAANETSTAGHTFVNASVGYRFLLRAQIVDLLLRGTNLTDREGRSHTSFLKDLAPLPGRDLGLSLRLLF